MHNSQGRGAAKKNTNECLLAGVYVPRINRMPGGVIVGDSGFCCCSVPVVCVASTVWLWELLIPFVCSFCFFFFFFFFSVRRWSFKSSARWLSRSWSGVPGWWLTPHSSKTNILFKPFRHCYNLKHYTNRTRSLNMIQNARFERSRLTAAEKSLTVTLTISATGSNQLDERYNHHIEYRFRCLRVQCLELCCATVGHTYTTL